MEFFGKIGFYVCRKSLSAYRKWVLICKQNFFIEKYIAQLNSIFRVLSKPLISDQAKFFIMERTKYATKSTTQLIDKVEKDEFLLSLAKDIKFGDIESASIRLDTLERKGNLKWLENYKSQSETLLHLAVKKHNDESFIRKLAELCPDLIFEKKLKEFLGQTALHISITKGNVALTKILLDVVQQKKTTKCPNYYTHWRQEVGL